MTPESQPVRVYLILGSNMGNRRRNLSTAVSLLVTQLAPWLFSDIRESEEVCKWVEQKLGRIARDPEYDAEGRRIYHSRTIDIDIVLYGDCQIDTPTLKIPHPQIEERDYAKRLLKQILY